MTLSSSKRRQSEFQRSEYNVDLCGAVWVNQLLDGMEGWIDEARNHRIGEDNTMSKVSWRSGYFSTQSVFCSCWIPTIRRDSPFVEISSWVLYIHVLSPSPTSIQLSSKMFCQKASSNTGNDAPVSVGSKDPLGYVGWSLNPWGSSLGLVIDSYHRNA